MAVIRIKVDGHLAQCVSVEPMATGSAGVDSVVIDRIDGSWDGFGLTAVFKAGDNVYYAAAENGGALIPAAALLSERFGLSLLGTKSDGQGGELRMTTNYVSFGIYAGAGSGGTYPDDPTETLYTEIREIAESAEAKAQSVVDRADAGEFTGPRGIQGPPGEVTEAELTEALAGKVSVVEGKGLSTNDFTDEAKKATDTVKYSNRALGFYYTNTEDGLHHSVTIEGGFYISQLQIWGCIGIPLAFNGNAHPYITNMTFNGASPYSSGQGPGMSSYYLYTYEGTRYDGTGCSYNNKLYTMGRYEAVYAYSTGVYMNTTTLVSASSWEEITVNGVNYWATPANTKWTPAMSDSKCSRSITPYLQFNNNDMPEDVLVTYSGSEMPSADNHYAMVRYLNPDNNTEEYRMFTTHTTSKKKITWITPKSAFSSSGRGQAKKCYLTEGENTITLTTSVALPDAVIVLYVLDQFDVRNIITDLRIKAGV